MRIAIADPCPFARSGMREALRHESDLDVVATTSTGADTIALVLNTRVDAAVVCADMGDMDGFTVSRLLAEHTRAILRSSDDPARDAVEALRSGAHGVVSRTSGPGVVIKALRETRSQDVFLEPTTLRRLLDKDIFSSSSTQRSSSFSSLSSLTEREREVLILTGQGLDNRDIAMRLTVSEGTVKTHVNRTMTKLGLSSRALLVVFCYENALITPAMRVVVNRFSKTCQPTR